MSTTFLKKRPFGATIRTLSDISNSHHPELNDPKYKTHASGISNNQQDATRSKISVHHIPTLPDADAASAILRRIHTEFHKIIERRGWNVVSITEMCCCGDGIDHSPHRKNKRKSRVMPNNVLGYNLTAFHYGKTHSIHLRLRHPKSHALFPYEDLAGTMCHELAHCLEGPHNAKFYKAMEEIEEQYFSFLARGVVVDKEGFPMGSKEAYVLGTGGGRMMGVGARSGGEGANKEISAEEARRRALEAAESRRRKCGLTTQHGYILGGKSKVVDPKQAVRIAAERRLLDSQYCLPCDEVIEILGGSSSEEEEEVGEMETKKQSSRNGEDKKGDHDVVCIDADEVELIGTDAASLKKESANKKGERGKQKRDKKNRSAQNFVGVAGTGTSSSTTTGSPSRRINRETSAASVKAKRFDSSDSFIDLTKGSSNASDSLFRPPPRDWECPCCTLLNLSTSLCCQACNASRPKSSPMNGNTSPKRETTSNSTYMDSIPNDHRGWDCPQCTFRNLPLVLVCDACSLERQCKRRQDT